MGNWGYKRTYRDYNSTYKLIGTPPCTLQGRSSYPTKLEKEKSWAQKCLLGGGICHRSQEGNLTNQTTTKLTTSKQLWVKLSKVTKLINFKTQPTKQWTWRNNWPSNKRRILTWDSAVDGCWAMGFNCTIWISKKTELDEQRNLEFGFKKNKWRWSIEIYKIIPKMDTRELNKNMLSTNVIYIESSPTTPNSLGRSFSIFHPQETSQTAQHWACPWRCLFWKSVSVFTAFLPLWGSGKKYTPEA